MDAKFQHTTEKRISCFGTGVHSGKTVSLTLEPAKVDTGIVFYYVDKQGSILSKIEANYLAVSQTKLCTSISSPDKKYTISTVEHLMAAIWGCGIDNLIVRIDGDEVPIMDGSSEQFVFMIECAGVKQQDKSRKFIDILKPIEVSIGDACAKLEPSDYFSVAMEIDFKDKVVGHQACIFDSRISSFKRDISRARTFGFVKDFEALRQNGLARGGSLENAVVIDTEAILNDGGLRYQNEFVKHKVLDSIGDLFLSGYRIKGHFSGVKSGHHLNNLLLLQLFSDKGSYRIVDSSAI